MKFTVRALKSKLSNKNIENIDPTIEFVMFENILSEIQFLLRFEQPRIEIHSVRTEIEKFLSPEPKIVKISTRSLNSASSNTSFPKMLFLIKIEQPRVKFPVCALKSKNF